MAKTDIAGMLTSVGAPFLKKLIEGSLPAPWNGVGSVAIDVLADRLGAAEATADAIVERYEADPKAALPIVQELEANPAVILAAVEQQKATNTLLLAEMNEPLWTWAWRPAGMWGLGALWFWNIIVLHVLNAAFKIALPPVDNGILLQLSALYMGLYMGGHTVKNFVAKRWGGA